MEKEEKHSSDTPIYPRLVSAAKLFSEAMSVFVFLMGVLILIGWKFNLQVLTSVSPYFVPMTPNGALGLLFLGLALWLLQEKRVGGLAHNLGRGSAILTSLLGFITIAEYALNKDFLIDDLLFHGVSGIGLIADYPGRIAIGSAFIFIFLGIALLLLDVKTKRGIRPSQFFSVLAGIISIAAIVGYVHNVEYFYQVWASSNAMSLYSALVFFMCHFGVLLARPESGITRVVFLNSMAGKVSRVLLPATFIGPLVISWLVEYGEHHNLYNLQVSLGLETNIDIIVFFLVAMAGVCLLEKQEEKKIIAESVLFENEKKIIIW